MTRVFVDTSAILALLNPADLHHDRAHLSFGELRDTEAELVTTSFVLIEAYALIGRRMGLEAVRAFRSDFAPLLEVLWVDRELHESGLDLLLDRQQRHLSLVDAVSFLAIRQDRIDRVFAFDRHFNREGFSMVYPDAL